MRVPSTGRLSAVITLACLLWAGVTPAIAAWSTAGLIDAGANDAYTPQIALDGSGNAVAVWQQHDGAAWRVYANRWDGSAWSGAVLIDAGAINVYDPQVAQDGSGTAVAVWRQSDGANNRIYANRWDGSAWSGATLIDAGSNDAYTPQIALDGSGTAVAVWSENYRIYASIFLPDRTQAEPVPTLPAWAMLLLVMLLGAVGTDAVGSAT
ncbi:MAG: hypothetical protein PHQ14_12015 [Chromatiales bacterium]|jgi:hypothetical protein|nr:hypothetical protein [Chromatiales bacterium]MDX9768595.1 hypothetical protein [Ectothiorhodospiraceae bacterium]